ncbi:GMC family oxidoreductase [Frigidibacter oleivorans]|uniref:GMC family oxidoreductase n=1 Tax=Frigidibacter oleivorans TaxID=2487129 RepID=UPI0013E0C081|nr:GMC family oxidoreductase N-terminal domain-containing protein [Frigidibacter oleivorans]
MSRRALIQAGIAAGLSAPMSRAWAQAVDVVQASAFYDSRQLEAEYDYIVCGSGSAGSVVARRLAEDGDATVLLIEAGGSDNHPSILNPSVWFTNVGTERAWNFHSVAQPGTNGRNVALPMGRAIGGGSSINGMAYVRGHKLDFDRWADITGDTGWNYENALSTFRRIENFDGPADPGYRGTGGILTMQKDNDIQPVARALRAAGPAAGLAAFDDINGAAMESASFIGHPDIKVRDRQRVNVPADYLYPILDQGNITVITGATVSRVEVTGDRATGVSFVWNGETRRVGARGEIILSMGAIHTPKVLMHSGIGDEKVLRKAGVRTILDLPGIGKNLQDHTQATCIWEFREHTPPAALLFSQSIYFTNVGGGDRPDINAVQLQIPFPSERTAQDYDIPETGWSILSGLANPRSRGTVEIVDDNPETEVRIVSNILTADEDMRAMRHGIELARELGASPEMRDFVKREVMPGPITGAELESYIRDSASCYFHMSGTCQMGNGPDSVVTPDLKVKGIEGLRIADTSIMPEITMVPTMPPAVFIGERAGQLIRSSS